ncbi:hypothetical protein H0194_08930 [Corynebacterium incognita]|uniref:DUF6036 domain-containing protein n=1 Tax=Corynebacterium incognita TaxID=2754725 RepID=A0A7G7CNK5_9CORY|nr:DUF6036 family nucleotidyltransferase [Corynebacterium incognita]QNE89171.1 hypothetical protein H0194_08930 [Corynebacterium incognita]
MRRADFDKCLAAIYFFTGSGEFVVMGSQAFHASISEEDLPEDVVTSREIDATYIPGRGSQEIANRLNAADFHLGELSEFHRYNGFHLEFVEPGTAILPSDWKEHLHTYRVRRKNDEDFSVKILSMHDAAVAKLMRLADKDKRVISALIESGNRSRLASIL